MKKFIKIILLLAALPWALQAKRPTNLMGRAGTPVILTDLYDHLIVALVVALENADLDIVEDILADPAFSYANINDVADQVLPLAIKNSYLPIVQQLLEHDIRITDEVVPTFIETSSRVLRDIAQTDNEFYLHAQQRKLDNLKKIAQLLIEHGTHFTTEQIQSLNDATMQSYITYYQRHQRYCQR